MQWLARAEAQLGFRRLQRSYMQPVLVRGVVESLLAGAVGVSGSGAPSDLPQLLCDAWRSGFEGAAHHAPVPRALAPRFRVPFEHALALVRRRHPYMQLAGGVCTLPLALADELLVRALVRHHRGQLSAAARRLPLVLQAEEGRLTEVLRALATAVAKDVDALKAPQTAVRVPAGEDRALDFGFWILDLVFGGGETSLRVSHTVLSWKFFFGSFCGSSSNSVCSALA